MGLTEETLKENVSVSDPGAAVEDNTLVEILEEDNLIDIAKYIGYVSAPQAGAIATFSGTTRHTFEGKAVVELRYEAYVPMAIRCLKSICSSARSSWDLHSVAVVHRLGTVPVGETSVFIAVSATHRDDALDACKFLIDELKASVPIWKKEVYTNGEVWKENKEFVERNSENAPRCGGRKSEMVGDNAVGVRSERMMRMVRQTLAPGVRDVNELETCSS